MSTEDPAPEDPVPEDETAEDQRPEEHTAPKVVAPDDTAERPADGLDLAKSSARAASRAPGGAKRKTYKENKPYLRRGRSGFSGAHPDDRDPQLLGSAVERLVDNAGWETDLKVQGVFGRWPELVGDEVASHCTPETLTDGVLVVRTDSTAWATQMRLLAPTVLRRLNVELGHGTVLKVEVLGPHLPTWKKGLRSSRGRGPRDTYG